jgi:MerR family mercuric resistance operon transcriptional regulator
LSTVRATHCIDLLTIGALAAAAGVNVETVRYYQRRGLLNEPRKPGRGIRRYGDADMERLCFVKGAQALGFSLDEVAELLTLAGGTHCREARELAQHKLEDVRGKLASLPKQGSARTSVTGTTTAYV